MEIPRIEIPQIKIKEIYIPRTRTWEQYPTTLDIIDKPSLEYPVVNFPSFEPLEYHPDKGKKKPDIPQPPKYTPKVKKDKEFFIKCPNESSIPVGSYPNELRLQIVIGHSIKNGQCYEIYRDSTFVEKWIPSPPVLVSTSIIAVAAASSPIIVNLVKNLVKTAIKKLTKKKNEIK
jgi:hypothetical protein